LAGHNHQTARGRSRRSIAALLAVLTGLAAVVTTVTLTAPAAQAVNGDGTSPFATYNMHGSDNGMLWRSEIQRLAANHAVVALQEAGNGPPMPAVINQNNRREIRLPNRPHGFPTVATEVVWPITVGANHVDRYVYYLQTDPRRIARTTQDTWAGGQMNLAMVTDTRADEVQVLENPTYNPDPNAPGNRYRARPLLGLRFGNTWYWDTHARGDDVQSLLNQLRRFAATDGRNWVLVGDFNVNILNRTDAEAARDSLHLSDDETLLRTGQPTYIAGVRPSELDYAITHGLPRFTATIPRGGGSDHVPVEFGRVPPLPQPDQLGSYANVLAAPNGGLLREDTNGSITIGPARYDNTQTFQMYTTDALTHYLRNVTTGDCIVVAPPSGSGVQPRMAGGGGSGVSSGGGGSGVPSGSDGGGSGVSSGSDGGGSGVSSGQQTPSPIVAGACGTPASQWTLSHLEDDPPPTEDGGGPQRWRSVAYPGLCLTPSGTAVIAAPCTSSASQRWWDKPTAIPSNVWKTTSSDIRLQSWYRGRIFSDRRIPLYTFVENDFTSPGTRFGWNIQQVIPGDNLVRLQSVANPSQCLGVSDEHSTGLVDTVMRDCDDPRGVAGAGQRWLAENYTGTYPGSPYSGTIRFRNEATYLCLDVSAQVSPVRLSPCQDLPDQLWTVTNR
jgi:hypothetical protein